VGLGGDILVHDTRKNAVGGVDAGQGLRGSSELHAFGDSNLYLRRVRERSVLLSEHGAAPASRAVSLTGPSYSCQTRVPWVTC
jgi:hypothetical protein